jgi:GNAT superfamily N-acetyltransferase
MSTPTADVSARVAWADDAEAIAVLQAKAWRVMYAGVLPDEALEPHPETWRAILGRPADARLRVLVAMDRHRVVGFALTAPASDPDCDPVADGEVADLTVDPDERGRGHGSRLLQAAADTLRADRFSRAVTWSMVGDDALRAFLTSAGWAADGAHRELDLDGTGTTTVKQVRLHTDLRPAASPES